ncbi:cell envelope biogenesis YhbN [Actinobacillus delphinicola]|uniref:Lipopolysaccharide export system protein LptA n=1 Tax=Actinobacillus delphinicola TaxID=51161 RepID=A0A448TVW5_9PAST|nr:cell envelope biogenesis YhbN [Actinobacillus delphinicola]
MNLNNRKSILLPLVLATTILAMAPQAFALKDDTRQPINVLSDKQSLNLASSQAVFTKNVYITQGSIQIKAHKVIVTRPKDKKKSETLDAYGSPVYFQQTLDDGKVVKGSADFVHYDLKTEFITLIGHAKLRQAESQIEGRKITYDVKDQQLKADGSTQRRVRTILIPSQLDDAKNAHAHQVKEEDAPVINFNTRAPLTQTEDVQKLHNEQKMDEQSTLPMQTTTTMQTTSSQQK